MPHQPSNPNLQPDYWRSQVESIFQAGVDAVDPARLVENAVIQDHLNDKETRGFVVVGAGKAGAAMAQGLARGLAKLANHDPKDHSGPAKFPCRGLVLVPKGSECQLGDIEVRAVRPSASNLPTPAAHNGTLELLRIVQTKKPGERIIVLLSGGASALTPAPVDKITLEEKLETTKLLGQSGATINQLNGVRKHLSLFKGGGLLKAIGHHADSPAVLTYILSDVVGDPLDVIGSGPTVADESCFADCIADCQKLGVWDRLPRAVRDHLAKGAQTPSLETLKSTPYWAINRVLGSNRIALEACAVRAKQLGMRVLNLGSFFEGDALSLANFHTDLIRGLLADPNHFTPVDGNTLTASPLCLLSGGEATMRLCPNPGPGGRNQAFALEMLLRLREKDSGKICLLSAGTDGEDGPTTAAGGWVDQQAKEKLTLWMKEHPAEAKIGLASQSSFTLLSHANALFSPGPSGTNVMDVRVGVLIPENL